MRWRGTGVRSAKAGARAAARQLLKSRYLLLIVVLALGQWLNIAHASRHPALSSIDKSCEFCLHAQGLGAGLVALPKPPAPGFVHETPLVLAAYFFSVAAPSHYPIRGPPRGV